MRTFIAPDGKSGLFQGGLKTAAGRGRIGPIHSAVFPLVMSIMDRNGNAAYLCGRNSGWFRREMKKTLVRLIILLRLLRVLIRSLSKHRYGNPLVLYYDISFCLLTYRGIKKPLQSCGSLIFSISAVSSSMLRCP